MKDSHSSAGIVMMNDMGQPARYRRTRIKVCGIRDHETAEAAVSAGADALGFVFADGSPRRVSPEAAEEIVLELAAPVLTVGVFRDATVTKILTICHEVGLGMVQLHGEETEADVAQVAMDVPVVRAIGADADQIGRWASNPDVEYLLIDGPTPGSGKPCDWQHLANVLRRAETHKRIILAGGLTPGNVAEAIRTIRPFAVDVSSGVESACGRKDATLIHEFCRCVALCDLSLHT